MYKRFSRWFCAQNGATQTDRFCYSMSVLSGRQKSTLVSHCANANACNCTFTFYTRGQHRWVMVTDRIALGAVVSSVTLDPGWALQSGSTSGSWGSGRAHYLRIDNTIELKTIDTYQWERDLELGMRSKTVVEIFIDYNGREINVIHIWLS